ncbi:putative cell pattern formation-associated protein stua protein [Phaeoacremonium minimum UCRPA7]|uniref:Putative cell pattern formation-associated protein stua protein n=1 Tax=Phaeoacremonium minimum (strain UCR-PA7) TaxID=1286976 RepID=R8BL11_PHAM7|nr:putative cell pattern formation-associated protein stua protein [Phaeoacremonium minimum UCRPA7]EON99897.1 putative cell pattern formation-associated protein stua protein [Phaeoacremonium minimum UCRPA7]
MGGPNVLPLPGVTNQPGMQNQYQGFDTTGQVAPPGMKPRVTATLWEDEGSLCFQVEARGICVARREDNHMINGTKLLNVAGMTRGRRDGILKSEKVRHVVKIGPMHLKGVWIPFERALDFANKEKITELLYPLFVHNIGALLYHPTNQNRTTQDPKATNGYPGQPGDSVPHPEEEAEHDHDTEYTHDSGAYDASRAQYNYNAPPVASMPNDHSHLSGDMTGAGNHQGASGRSTPRSAAAPPSYYAQPGYNTPPRAPQQSSSLYNVMSNDRGPTNGGPGGDVYAPQPDMGSSMQNGYPTMNGAPTGLKRGRDDDDDRPSSGGAGMGGFDLKRRKTIGLDGSMPSPGYDNSMRQPTAIAAPRRR